MVVPLGRIMGGLAVATALMVPTVAMARAAPFLQCRTAASWMLRNRQRYLGQACTPLRRRRSSNRPSSRHPNLRPQPCSHRR